MSIPSEDGLIGRRFVSDDHFGIVRYVGEVPPTKGLWLGVEWDDPLRGRHDGTHGGVKYFNCSFPTSGSFLRPAKADFGRSFIAALEEKYIPNDMETGDVEVMQLGNKIIEMVGAKKIAKKQSSFENLIEVVLRSERIGRAGEENIAERVPNIETLNISKNLLTSWEELAKITRQLKRLAALDVSDSELAIPHEPESLKDAFQNLSELFFNRVNISWSQILQCAPMWPNLKKLHICFNSLLPITSIPETHLQSLELLNVEGNGIPDWDAVLHFGKLPKLHSLILNANEFDTIYFNDCEPGEKTAFFPRLRLLSLNRNKIDDWKAISQLEKLNKLEVLSFKFNPLTQSATDEDVREVIIAKIASLKVCNNSGILAYERKGAELMYLKKHCVAWLKSGGSRDPQKSAPSREYKELHPRFEKLVEIYDAPDEAETKERPNDLKSTLLAVTITCPQNPSNKVLKKKLPSGMEVQKLKSLIQKIFKINVCDQRIYYHQQDKEQEIEMDNDLRPLDFFALETGDTIVVKYAA